MSSSKKQVKSDATMATILVANAVRVFDEKDFPNDEEEVLAAEAPVSDHRMHVDARGYLTTKSSVRGKSSK